MLLVRCCDSSFHLTTILSWGDSLTDHWEIVLATKLFCSVLTNYRTNRVASYHTRLGNDPEGMCGSTKDLAMLKAGLRYFAEPFYDALCNGLSLEANEKEFFSRPSLERLVSVCKRNAVDVNTRSSFALYKGNMLQEYDGSTETPQYKQNIEDTTGVLIRNGFAGDVEELGQVDCYTLRQT